MKEYMTIRQLAKHSECPISEYCLRKLIRENKIPHIKVSPRKNLIELSAFIEWLDASQK